MTPHLRTVFIDRAHAIGDEVINSVILKLKAFQLRIKKKSN